MPTLAKILYVEDDLDIQTIARMALEAVGGFTVEICDGGAQALERAPIFAPDLMLLDVMMPDMDGPTTLQNLRKIAGLEKIPAVFMTAKVMEFEMERYRDMGVVDVISKPFDPMTLHSRIQSIWDAFHDG